MPSTGLFEVHITTHQHGSSGTDYRAVHRQMVAQGFERVAQTTAQVANEVPGVYRLQNAQLTTSQVVEMVRLALKSLGRGMAVQVMKVEEERLFNLIPGVAPSREDSDPTSVQPLSSETGVKAQSGYPAWRRPR